MLTGWTLSVCGVPPRACAYTLPPVSETQQAINMAEQNLVMGRILPVCPAICASPSAASALQSGRTSKGDEPMKRWQTRFSWLAPGMVVLGSGFVLAQAPVAGICGEAKGAAWQA